MSRNIVVRLVALGLIALALPVAVRAQVADRPTFFLHGINADSVGWTGTANTLSTEFAIAKHLPTYGRGGVLGHGGNNRYSNQLAELLTDMAGAGDSLITIAHSQGGIMSRLVSENGGHNHWLATVGTPYTGAPLANVVMSGQIVEFPAQTVQDIVNALGYYGQTEGLAHGAPFWVLWLWDKAFGYGLDIANLFANYPILVGQLAQADAPALQDLATTSAYFTAGNPAYMNSSTKLAQDQQNLLSRVSMVAQYNGPPGNIFINTFTGRDSADWADARYGTFAGAVVAFDYYENDLDPEDPYYPELHSATGLWALVAFDMLSVDVWWETEIGAIGNCYRATHVCEYVESDGIVPAPRQANPVPTRNVVLLDHPLTHLKERTSPDVLAALEGILHNDFKILQRQEIVASIGITPSAPSVYVGSTLQLNAALHNAQGSVVTGRTPKWTSSNPSAITVSGSGTITGQAVGSAQISASIDGVTATVTATAANPPPPPPPPFTSVTITGSAPVRPNAFCTWYATTDGGTGLTFAWTVNGSAAGDGTAALSMQAPTATFTLGVTATDGEGTSQSTTFPVAVSSSAPPCLQ